jgi:Family of unknown function (DUF6272)
METTIVNIHLKNENWFAPNTPQLNLCKKINQPILDAFLKEATEFLNAHSITKAIHTKVYSVLVEGIENASRHQQKSGLHQKVFCQIEIVNKTVKIALGNYINNLDVAKISQHIEYLNTLTTNEIKTRVANIVTNKLGLSDKGGAGVGLYLIKNKCKKITHHILNFDNNNYLVLHLTIN